MDTADWASDWPRCLLLLELATQYAESGRAHGCAKLTERLEEWRRRMEEAPPSVHALLSELCYVCWLLKRGDLAMARHHVAKAQQKTEEIRGLLREWRRQASLRDASHLRRQFRHLRRQARDLREQSDLLRAQSVTLRRRSASPSPPGEALSSGLVLV